LLNKIEKDYLKDVPNIKAGQTVRAHTYIIEGGKTRVQIFEGIVIAIKGTGAGKMITVRKISSGVGVERIFRSACSLGNAFVWVDFYSGTCIITESSINRLCWYV